jgi:hypothetical protein
MRHGEKQEKDKGLRNILDEDESGEPDFRKKSTGQVSTQKNREHTDLDERPLPREDFIDIGMRGILAFLMAVFFSAIVAGMIEANPDWDIEIGFASLPMIGITALFYYPTYKTLSWMGFFRRKKGE